MFNLFPQILAFSFIFLTFVMLYKMTTYALSTDSSERVYNSPMKKRNIFIALSFTIFYMIFSITWISFLAYTAKIPNSLASTFIDENNPLLLFLRISVIVISLFTTFIFYLLIRSFNRLLQYFSEYNKQQRNNTYNHLIHAIDNGYSKEMIENYTILLQSGKRIELSTNEWLTLLSTLVSEGESDLSKRISQSLRGKKVIYKSSPIKKVKRAFIK